MVRLFPRGSPSLLGSLFCRSRRILSPGTSQSSAPQTLTSTSEQCQQPPIPYSLNRFPTHDSPGFASALCTKGSNHRVATSIEQIEKFQRDGVVLLKGVLDVKWQKVLAEAIDRDIQSPGPFHHNYQVQGSGASFHGNMRLWETDDGFRQYCTASPLPEIASSLLGANKVNLFYDQLFVKFPGMTMRTRWHNDQPYWPVRGQQVLSLWTSLDPVPCLLCFRLVRRSRTVMAQCRSFTFRSVKRQEQWNL
mmetsp:Transcript_26184/g.40978  ORF Transcript_26184/g.40978 Transcript_26184/m.40978 type:complete len:249 (+) Transcript_26184:62-808(+)